MSTVAPSYQQRVPVDAIDARRGSEAMWMFVATEAMLFIVLFFAYYFLERNGTGWPDQPPKLRMALPMLAVLLTSSAILHAGERAARRGAIARAKLLTLITIFFGAGFLVMQALEYREHMKTLLPTTNAYGSIFYTITSLHGAHVLLGMLMLAYVLLLPAPQIGRAEKPPHHSLHNAGIYWHFVDTVWVFIVALLYVVPNIGR